jgi:LPS-assembly lipoprotein
MLPALAGCGFQPVYGPYSAAPVVNEDMAAIRVATIEDRMGQQLRLLLEERLQGGRPPIKPSYTLTVKTSTGYTDSGIRRDDTATRARVTVEASYTVHARDQEGILTSGRARSIAAYDLLEANYASVIAERDAQNQAAREIADQIVAQVASYFTARRNGRAAPP